MLHQLELGSVDTDSAEPRFEPWLYVNCWWRGVVVNALVVINEVTLRRARLVLGRMTVCGRVNHLGM